MPSIAKLAQGGWKLAPRKETRQAAQPCGKLACFHAGSIEKARLLIQIAAVFSGVIDFLPAFALLMTYVLYRGFWPTWKILLLPGFFLLTVVASLGVGLWLSALNVGHRDVRYTVPFLTQVWLFSTLIAYPSSLMHEPWRTVYGLNPMVGVVEGFRWAVLGSGNPPGTMFFVSCLAALALLVAGAFYFRRMEKGFADIV